jgi:hypothetical protein
MKITPGRLMIRMMKVSMSHGIWLILNKWFANSGICLLLFLLLISLLLCLLFWCILRFISLCKGKMMAVIVMVILMEMSNQFWELLRELLILFIWLKLLLIFWRFLELIETLNLLLLIIFKGTLFLMYLLPCLVSFLEKIEIYIPLRVLELFICLKFHNL